MTAKKIRSAQAPEWLGLPGGAIPLLIAHLVQARGAVPCALCYLERWPYRVAIVLALLGLLAPRGPKLAGPLLVICFLAAFNLAALHVGVEWGWWRSPLPECAAPILHTGSVGDLLSSMPARPSKPCDDPTYLIPSLRLSMAELNAIYALAMTAAVAMSLRWRGVSA